jgi:hypothetical protein
MDLTRAAWRKSSYSGNNGGACVEIAATAAVMGESARVVAVRDSKDPDGTALAFTRDRWEAFTRRVQSGALDLG